MRPIIGATNICHFAWEFDVLKDHTLVSESFLSNQVYMLSLFDEIWAPCHFTVDVLRSSGLENVRLVPTPICENGGSIPREPDFVRRELGAVPAVPLRLSSGVSRGENMSMCESAISALSAHPTIKKRLQGRRDGRIYVTICSPGDLRKNLINIIDGFRIGRGADDVLIVKLVVRHAPGMQTAAQFDHVRPLYKGPAAVASDNVLFVVDYLEWSQMESLYTISDFYICASHGEGFNLPLLEAMSYGVVPISTDVTAMADYIRDDNAIRISSVPVFGFQPGMAADVSGKPYAVAVASQHDIAAAVSQATVLSTESVAAMGQRARATVANLYSYPSIQGMVQARLSAVMSRREESED
jgi:glycosyltransferase involved in cell wall biosynthesis